MGGVRAVSLEEQLPLWVTTEQARRIERELLIAGAERVEFERCKVRSGRGLVVRVHRAEKSWSSLVTADCDLDGQVAVLARAVS